MTGRFIIIVISDISGARAVLQSARKGCTLGLTKLPGEINLISSDGNDWKWRRQHESAMFSGQSVRLMESLIADQVQVMLNVLSTKQQVRKEKCFFSFSFFLFSFFFAFFALGKSLLQIDVVFFRRCLTLIDSCVMQLWMSLVSLHTVNHSTQ